MYDERGPSDPVRRSNTTDIDGELIEPDTIRIIDVDDREDNPIGMLIRWNSACWMWGDNDSVVSLSQMV